MKLFSSEQVACGHPDKVCDQISDAVLDACLRQDINSRVAVETMVKDNTVVLAGEITSNAQIDVEKIVSYVYCDIGIDTSNVRIINLISNQSPDIALGVDTGGAGDQGMMYGYACRETPQRLPLAYVVATDALKKLRELESPILGPDAKSQVTMQYNDDGTKQIHTFLISTQHASAASQSDVREIVEPVMITTAKQYGLPQEFKVLVNPTGRFVVGGSWGDAGVTGRKIVADTYGGYARHGGGAFSGKDFSKVDRSAAYMARYIAKHLLNKFELEECEVQLSYAIGVKDPLSVNVNATDINCVVTNAYLERHVRSRFDLTPGGIIEFLDLRNVCYYDTAKYGHFTNPLFHWEIV